MTPPSSLCPPQALRELEAVSQPETKASEAGADKAVALQQENKQSYGWGSSYNNPVYDSANGMGAGRMIETDKQQQGGWYSNPVYDSANGMGGGR
jgi:hypothetical protein